MQAEFWSRNLKTSEHWKWKDNIEKVISNMMGGRKGLLEVYPLGASEENVIDFRYRIFEHLSSYSVFGTLCYMQVLR
jgi:hypothetical protein